MVSQLTNHFIAFVLSFLYPFRFYTFQGQCLLGLKNSPGGSDFCREINILITLWETWDHGQMDGAPVLTPVTGYESVAMVNMAPMLVQYTTQTADCYHVNMLLMSVKIWDQHEPFATVYALHGFYMCRESNHFRFSLLVITFSPWWKEIVNCKPRQNSEFPAICVYLSWQGF